MFVFEGWWMSWHRQWQQSYFDILSLCWYLHVFSSAECDSSCENIFEEYSQELLCDSLSYTEYLGTVETPCFLHEYETLFKVTISKQETKNKCSKISLVKSIPASLLNDCGPAASPFKSLFEAELFIIRSSDPTMWMALCDAPCCTFQPAAITHSVGYWQLCTARGHPVFVIVCAQCAYVSMATVIMANRARNDHKHYRLPLFVEAQRSENNSENCVELKLTYCL